MKGFKPTGCGPKSGFAFPSKMGFTGSTGSVTSVAGYTRRKGYAQGGFVKEGYQPKVESVGDSGHATIYRNRPSTNLDQESGGKTPLRPGFSKGGKNWIQGAIKHPGALHKALGVPQGQKIPARKLAKAAHSNSGKMRQRAALAKTLGTMNKAGGGRVAKKPPPSSKEEYGDGGKAEMLKGAIRKMLTGVADPYARPKHDDSWKSLDRISRKAHETSNRRARAMADLQREAKHRADIGVFKGNALGVGPLEPEKFGDGGKAGMISNLVKRVMGKAKTAESATAKTPAEAVAAPVTQAAPKKSFQIIDRHTGLPAGEPYTYKALRDAAISRKNEKAGAVRFVPIDSTASTAKRRGGPVKMPRC